MSPTKQGNGLRLLLHSCGIRPAQLAELVGESRQSVTNWMSRGLPANQIFAVASALNLQPEDLRPYISAQRISDAELLDIEVEAFLDRLPKLPKAKRAYVIRRLVELADADDTPEPPAP